MTRSEIDDSLISGGIMAERAGTSHKRVRDKRVAGPKVKGKPRRSRYKLAKTSEWKRAIVVLDENSRIELF